MACVKGLSTSVHKRDVRTTVKIWPLPNSGHLICMSLKLVKVFAPSGRSGGERDKKELQNESHRVRDETKEM